jgi:hypothetical protein
MISQKKKRCRDEGCGYILFVGSSLLVPRTVVLILCTVEIYISGRKRTVYHGYVYDVCVTPPVGLGGYPDNGRSGDSAVWPDTISDHEIRTNASS